MSQYKYKRIFLIVLDSMGMGDAADAADYGDKGSDKIPNLVKLGLANLKPMQGVEPAEKPMGLYTALNEKSRGKDTMTGHWEMMGIYTTQPFVTFTDTGFPKELIDELERLTGHEIIGNKSASGTEILEMRRPWVLIICTSTVRSPVNSP